MSLDNIRLTGNLQRAFFKNSLLDLQKSIQSKTIEQRPAVDYLGGNEKKIIFISKDTESKYLDDIQMNFLQDLLAACLLTMADIALVNFSQNKNLSYQVISEGLGAKKILMFGVTASQLDLPFNIPHFQIQNFNDQVFLLVPSLKEIQMNVELKKNLWASLQKVFNVKRK
jgi:hypothetical protein